MAERCELAEAQLPHERQLTWMPYAMAPPMHEASALAVRKMAKRKPISSVGFKSARVCLEIGVQGRLTLGVEEAGVEVLVTHQPQLSSSDLPTLTCSTI